MQVHPKGSGWTDVTWSIEQYLSDGPVLDASLGDFLNLEVVAQERHGGSAKPCKM